MSAAAESGYYDLQVNGYAGVDFNADDLAVESLHEACARLRADGVDQVLATIITADLDAMSRRLQRLAACRAEDPLVRQVIAGVHVEGPFISAEAGFVGAHPAQETRDATVDAAMRLIDAADGSMRLLTLAPERDADGAVTRRLVDQGVRVSAGHCNPSLEQLRRAIDAGLSMFTHLGNGCPLALHRHDNIIQRVLSLADRLWISFIADGVHVPFVALRNYLSLVGPTRAIVVTDAVSAAGMGPGVYSLASRQVVVDEGLATWSADGSHLVGSASTMKQMVRNLRQELSLPDEMIVQLTDKNPRAVVGR